MKGIQSHRVNTDAIVDNVTQREGSECCSLRASEKVCNPLARGHRFQRFVEQILEIENGAGHPAIFGRHGNVALIRFLDWSSADLRAFALRLKDATSSVVSWG